MEKKLKMIRPRILTAKSRGRNVRIPKMIFAGLVNKSIALNLASASQFRDTAYRIF